MSSARCAVSRRQAVWPSALTGGVPVVRAIACLLGVWQLTAGGSSEVLGAPPSFERDVRPIFKAYCFDCHGAEEKLSGGLDLRLRRLAVQGGESGAAIEVGKPAESLLIERMRSGEMPPFAKKVPPEKLAVVEAWIAAGATTDRVEPERLPPGVDITPEERAWWAFQPLVRPSVPQLAGVVGSPEEALAQPQADLVVTPVDAFVLASLRARGLRMAPPADRATLLNRVAFDLTGLPAPPDEVERFLADTAPDAYERMVDRFLNSPHYGERWARHWLDAAGYAESEGTGSDDSPRPYAYKYRDYVIQSLNSDKSFRDFLIEQLAGDELVPLPWNNLTPDQVEKLVATGFLRMGVDGTATGPDSEETSNLVVADALKIVSTSLLGLSVGCAQCHDHKYDPIPQIDYYRLRAVFEPALDPAHWRRPAQRLVSLYTDVDRARAAEVDKAVQTLQVAFNEKQSRFVNEAFEKALEKFPEDQRPVLREAYTTPDAKRTDAQKKLLADNPSLNINPGVLYQYNQPAADELKKDQQVIDTKRAEKPVEEFVSVTNEVPGVVPATHLFHRGDYRDKRQTVTPGDLTIAAPEGARFEIPERGPEAQPTGRRLAWARHLTSGTHPLLGRVLVNRFWMHHFGRGIVETPADFGLLGTRPTHPELLDWLASEFAARGFSLKEFHRLVLRSAVYRQASQPRPGGVNPREIDTLNTLYWQYPVRRLDAEVLRDRMLVTSDRLDRRLAGAPVPVEEDFSGQVLAGDAVRRRSLYLQVRRSKPVSFLAAFDAPIMTVNCERRIATTGAIQSLMLMNGESVLKEAGHFAERVRRETSAGYRLDEAQQLWSRFPPPGSAWRYGFGSFDPATGRVAGYQELPHFTGAAWQGGGQLPDPGLGWVLVNAAGGHPGDAQHAAIRRWTAPRAGRLTWQGKLGHGSANGDGVRGRLVSDRRGSLGEWSVKAGEAATNLEPFLVEAGEVLDWIVDCHETVESDSFTWAGSLQLTDDAGTVVGGWDTSADFHGPNSPRLLQQAAQAWRIAYQREITPEEWEWVARFTAGQLAQLREVAEKSDHELAVLTSLCQQLLSSNEFLYVD